MTGLSSVCNPEPGPTIWLCHDGSREPAEVPPWLTEYEQRTVAQFGGPRRREYLASRWLIRQALAGATGQAAAHCKPVDGRPVQSATPAGWRLSLSHSHGLSACATSSGGDVGLDIEPCARHPHWQRITRRWFSPLEQEWLLAEDNPETFLRVWTLKEAWLKATGRGIAGNLQTLEVRPGFDLYGDQPGPEWQASCYRVGDFLVTLVYRQNGPETPGLWRLATPPGDFALAGATALAEPGTSVLQRTIHSGH